MEVLLLVLIGVVLVFGLSVVVWNRIRTSRQASDDRVAPVVAPVAAPVAPPVPDAEAPDEMGAATQPQPEPEAEAPASFSSRMARARGALAGALLGVRNRDRIDDTTWDDLEEALLRADVGVRVAGELLAGLKARVKAKEITDATGLLAALQAEMRSRLDVADRSLKFEMVDDGGPNVWLFVGVNGVGKTTTIGKVSAQQVALGRSVLMAAGDTFRAAAAEQLTTWAERSGAEIVRGNEGGDPSAVIFDGVERAASRGIDLVLADTAGRLHTKSNLMDELRKVRRVADKGRGKGTEVLLVIDATTRQNGLTPARPFG